MTFWKCAGVAALLAASLLAGAPASAADAVTGRWAADPSACEGGFFAPSPLVVTSYAVRWQGDTCRIGRMYKAGETTYIQALCWTATGERSIPVSLQPHGGRLSVSWDRGRRGELRRCP